MSFTKMLISTSLRIFYSGLMILLSIGATFFFRCDQEAKLQSQSGKKSEFSIVTSDADTIVYTPIDSMLVIEFSEGLSKESKQSIIDEFNLKLLSISHSKKQALQTLEKSTLVFGCDQAENYRIRKEIKKKYPEDVRGTLPAFTHRNPEERSYLRPTTFGIIFYLDTPQEKAADLFSKHNLSVSNNWIEEHFYAYYITRLVHVNIPKQNDLFAVIHSLSKETEIYSAFPLYVNGGYALPHGPSPISPKFTNIRKAPPYLNKIEGNLQQIYWVWKTAPMMVLKELADRSHIHMFQDSIKVNIKLDKIDLYEVRQLLIENRVRPLGSINDAGNFLAFSGIVRWQDIESFVANEKVQKINISGEATIGGRFDLDEIPPPPKM